MKDSKDLIQVVNAEIYNEFKERLSQIDQELEVIEKQKARQYTLTIIDIKLGLKSSDSEYQDFVKGISEQEASLMKEKELLVRKINVLENDILLNYNLRLNLT